MVTINPKDLPEAQRVGFFSAQCEALQRLSRPIWILDVDSGRMHWANDAALKLWDAASVDELRARDLSIELSSTVLSRLRQSLQHGAQGAARQCEPWSIWRHGHLRSMNVIFSGHYLADGRVAALCESTDLHTAELSSVRSIDALNHTPVMITLYDWQGQVLHCNPAALESRAIDAQGHRFLHEADFRKLFSLLVTRGEARITALVRTRRGHRWHDTTACRCRDAASGCQAFLVTEVDVTEHKRTQEQAEFLAHHDPLTGLRNRISVMNEFGCLLAELHRQGQRAALIYIDLDNFKTINDSMGHAFGDQLLVSMAERLRGAITDSDLVARIGGDEFLVLSALPPGNHSAQSLTQRLFDAISRSVTLMHTEVRVTPSIGVSRFPEDGEDIDTLIRHADLAMYSAKSSGRNAVAGFTQAMRTAVEHRMRQESELRLAIERREFEVFYQPRLTFTNSIVSAEALVRWRHPIRGLVPPAQFVPICEEIGLIGALGDFVLEAAVRQQVAWHRLGLPIRMAVNLSPRQFSSPNLLSTVTSIVKSAGGDPASIELEITESMLMGNDQRTQTVLDELNAQGFSIALDDFGTGYSNLAYLQRYPLSTLKIDRSFVKAIGTSSPLTELIITMCAALKLHIVAEGVERQEQLDWLTQRGVDEYQGYLFSPPVPASEFTALLATSRAPTLVLAATGD